MPFKRFLKVEKADGRSESWVEPVPLTSVAEIAPLDRRAFGVDRAVLLGVLADRYGKSWMLPGAYLMSRPGSNARFLGPCVAERPEDAERLIRSLLTRHRGEPVFWDPLPDNQEVRALAATLGFEAKRRLVRMARTTGSCSKLQRQVAEALQIATAGFEYG